MLKTTDCRLSTSTVMHLCCKNLMFCTRCFYLVLKGATVFVLPPSLRSTELRPMKRYREGGREGEGEWIGTCGVGEGGRLPQSVELKL